MHKMKFTILTILQFCGNKSIHIVMQLSPLYITRTFLSPPTETLYPINIVYIPSSPTPGNHHFTFCLYEFDYCKYLI